jgi:hypothetical protein
MEETKSRCVICQEEAFINKLSDKGRNMILVSYNDSKTKEKISNVYCYNTCFPSFKLNNVSCVLCDSVCQTEDWFLCISNKQFGSWINYKAICSESCANKIISSQEGSSQRICQNCANPIKENPKRCGKCHRAFYCSKECQKADWPSHKEECSPPK